MSTWSDLCTLADVKAWLGNTATSLSDAQISGLITSVSRVLLTYINRPYILPYGRTEYRDGTGNAKLMLRDWPVSSIQSLTVDGVVVPPCPSPPFAAGYMLEPSDDFPPGAMQQLVLQTQTFGRGLNNVAIVYTAGYQVTGEAWTVPPTPFQVTVGAPFGNWATDQGVTYATGAALTKVASGPTVGQYAVALGLYTFAAADAGAAVKISYGYVPADLKQACIQAVGDIFNYRNRIGIQSKTLAGQETITYSLKDLSDTVKLMLSQYMRVVSP
jgi:hypothetical protein